MIFVVVRLVDRVVGIARQMMEEAATTSLTVGMVPSACFCGVLCASSLLMLEQCLAVQPICFGVLC